ncbi:pentatricopeptide repeat-containing protein At3g14730 [Telopea speciosissima]|uniref:pentatricopeptide repeat-containing protein At3g14730 n=1 Tax=Telopea speciosissima TaxID=54955 RepID=UPI001CC51AD1|nr:pentatricopeptide repeat-containing protein At3g14730 [Telopea speciosissima]
MLIMIFILLPSRLVKKAPRLPNFSSSATTIEAAKESPINLSRYITYLQSCAINKNLTKGKEIHSCLVVTGLLCSPFSITSLINMYSKCNQLDDALSIFNGAHDRNIFAWNAIIAGFITNGLSRSAFEFYQRMKLEGVAPDKYTLPCLIKACSDISEVVEVKKIHSGLFKIGLESNDFVSSALINFYLKFNFVQEAQQLFEELTERDVVLWNAMIIGYAQMGEVNLALRVFERMGKEGVVHSNFTLTGILSVFAMIGDVNNGRAVHGYAVKIGCESEVVVANSLIDMYGKCKSISEALRVFEMMLERDVFSWNSIISVHEQYGDHDKTLRLFERMQKAGVRSDTVTIAAVLPACSNLAALMRGREIHGYMIVNGLMKDDYGEDIVDVYVDNAVLDMYVKCGSLRDACMFFDKMRKRDVASWNIMIMGYGLHGFGDEAVNVFLHMGESSVRPDEVSFICVLSACSHAGLVDQGCKILAHMEEDHGVVPTVEHYACVVDMLGRAGRLDEAYELALGMPIEPNPVVWRAFLASCRLHGNTKLAEFALQRLLELEPEHCGSYVLMSNIYGTIGRYEEVSDIRHTMIERNVKKTPGCSWVELKSGVHVFVTVDRTHAECDCIYEELDGLYGHLHEYGYVPDARHM